jgi:hypothetical protein
MWILDSKYPPLVPHQLEVSFTNVKPLCQLRADPAHLIPPPCAVAAHWCPWSVSSRPVLAVCPRTCGLLGLSQNYVLMCWLQIWLDEIWHLNFKEFDSLVSPIRQGPILLECEVFRVLLYVRQKISHKQYIVIVLAILTDARANEVKACLPSADTPIDTRLTGSTLVECGEATMSFLRTAMEHTDGRSESYLELQWSKSFHW